MDEKTPSIKKKSLFVYVDKVWVEVILFAIWFLCYLLMDAIHAVFHGTVWYNQGLGYYPIGFTYAFFTIILLSIIFCYCSLVRHKKQKTLLSGCFFYQCFGKGKKLGRLANELWKQYCNMKAFKRYLILLLLYVFFWLILGILWMSCSWNVEGEIFVGGIFMGLVLLGITGGLIVSAVRNADAHEKIWEGTKRIAGGEITYQIPLSPKWSREQTGLAEEINRIRKGLEQAVESGVKSERMKAELITNVSHDIKTPLTSVINYVDLLKREKPDNPKIIEYLDVLEQKSQRLKVLIEDLVEASKASSGAIELQITTLNFRELVNQTEGEFEEKFTAAGLTLVANHSQESVLFRGDGRRVYRVLENLYGNVAKYAMPGTRVYTELRTKEDIATGKKSAEFTIKNISREPLNISPEELTERFVRGEESRTTEGSGLGLSIARSLTELMGGSFSIYLDGDLFRVTLEFPVENICC
jgi:signal transduction histidine kinase